MTYKEESFEELFNNWVKDVKLDKTVEGTIIDINSKNEIIVDLGYKSDGIIPKTEYSFNEDDDPSDEFKIGDKITADVLKTNDGLGNVLLSYKRAKLRKSKENFNKKVKNEEIIETVITSVSDKGFITNYEGIRIFIPISLSGITREENIEDYKQKKIKYKIIEYDEKSRKIIGSVKAINEEEREKNLKIFWDEIKIGKEYKGKVTSISTYGAFIDLGIVQGLLHISEMSWGRNQIPNEILELGQEIEVITIDVDKENRRLKLSYKGKGPDPWENLEEKYSINDIVKVKVMKLMPFGAFVELETGIEGLVHISQISERKIAKPEEELKLGEMVNAKIIDLDKENKKLELSIKELEGTSNEYKEYKKEIEN